MRDSAASPRPGRCVGGGAVKSLGEAELRLGDRLEPETGETGLFAGQETDRCGGESFCSWGQNHVTPINLREETALIDKERESQGMGRRNWNIKGQAKKPQDNLF